MLVEAEVVVADHAVEDNPAAVEDNHHVVAVAAGNPVAAADSHAAGDNPAVAVDNHHVAGDNPAAVADNRAAGGNPVAAVGSQAASAAFAAA